MVELKVDVAALVVNVVSQGCYLERFRDTKVSHFAEITHQHAREPKCTPVGVPCCTLFAIQKDKKCSTF